VLEEGGELWLWTPACRPGAESLPSASGRASGRAHESTPPTASERRSQTAATLSPFSARPASSPAGGRSASLVSHQSQEGPTDGTLSRHYGRRVLPSFEPGLIEDYGRRHRPDYRTLLTTPAAAPNNRLPSSSPTGGQRPTTSSLPCLPLTPASRIGPPLVLPRATSGGFCLRHLHSGAARRQGYGRSALLHLEQLLHGAGAASAWAARVCDNHRRPDACITASATASPAYRCKEEAA